MGRRLEVRKVRNGFHSTRSQQGSSMRAAGHSWEQVICQNKCPWPGPLVHLSQHNGSFLQPWVDGGTKATNSPALLFRAAEKGVSVYLCLSREQSVLTATGCHEEAHLVFDWMIFGHSDLFFNQPIHTKTTGRWTQNMHLNVCAAGLFWDTQWEKTRQSHPISLTAFTLT